MASVLKTTSAIAGFTLATGQTSQYLKIPSGSEISIVIPTIGTSSAGTLTMDYVVSTPTVDAQVVASPSTASWINSAPAPQLA